VAKILVLYNGVENEYKEAWEDWEEAYGRVILVNDLELADWDITMIRYNELQKKLEGILFP
jgi:hypothetical protein